MSLTLNPELEQRIQREIDLGLGRTATEVIGYALDLIEADQFVVEAEKADLNARLARSVVDVESGRVYSADAAAFFLDQRITERTTR